MRRVLVSAFAVGGLLTGYAAGAQPDAARLDTNRFPASAPSETLLHVAQPGRFAIATHSATGTALDLIDMITGPTPAAGSPGNADGRLDLLLDMGVYEIRLSPAAGAHGDVQLRVAPFTDAAPPAIMPHTPRPMRRSATCSSVPSGSPQAAPRRCASRPRAAHSRMCGCGGMAVT